MTYITDSPRTDGAPSKDWVEGLRPSSPTLDLARRSLGLTEESLRAVRLSDFKAPGVPSEIVRMRFDHAEGKRLNLVSELRARYVQLKEEAARQAEAEEQLTLSQASQAAYMASPRRSSVAEYEIKRHERLARRREQEESRKAAHERAMEESARKGVEALERERVKKAEELKRRALAAKKDQELKKKRQAAALEEELKAEAALEEERRAAHAAAADRLAADEEKRQQRVAERQARAAETAEKMEARKRVQEENVKQREAVIMERAVQVSRHHAAAHSPPPPARRPRPTSPLTARSVPRPHKRAV